MSSRAISLALTASLLAVVGYMTWSAFDFGEEARRVPIVVGMPVTAFLVVQFIRELLGFKLGPAISDAQEAEDDDSETTESAEPDSLATEEEGASAALRTQTQRTPSPGVSAPTAFVWVLALGLSFYVFGMLLTVPLFMAAFMRIYGREKWTIIGLFVVVTVAVMHFFFVVLLEVQLYPGNARDWVGL